LGHFEQWYFIRQIKIKAILRLLVVPLNKQTFFGSNNSSLFWLFSAFVNCEFVAIVVAFLLNFKVEYWIDRSVAVLTSTLSDIFHEFPSLLRLFPYSQMSIEVFTFVSVQFHLLSNDIWLYVIPLLTLIPVFQLWLSIPFHPPFAKEKIITIWAVRQMILAYNQIEFTSPP
jgi:hypothetical protein